MGGVSRTGNIIKVQPKLGRYVRNEFALKSMKLVSEAIKKLKTANSRPKKK